MKSLGVNVKKIVKTHRVHLAIEELKCIELLITGVRLGRMCELCVASDILSNSAERPMAWSHKGSKSLQASTATATVET